MNYFRAPVLLSLFLAFASVVQALSTVTRAGRYLYTDPSTRFYIRGVAYQPQGEVTITDSTNPFMTPQFYIDPLFNISTCQRDLPFLQQLKVNVIRVYSVNSSLNHDDCMNLFSKAGIYTIIDLSLPVNGSINNAAPSWSTNLLDQYIATIDAFSKYDNVLAYNVGNEVITALNTTGASPYVKAAARDTKAYLLSKSSSVLVGYAAIDGTTDFVLPLAELLSCDPSNTNSNSTSIDLYGLNDYEWCGASSFEASYAGTVSEFSQYNVVTYFSEFGCITSPPRLWTEVAAMFSAEMNMWSGGIAFSYYPAASSQGQFGMVNISADGSTVTTSSDFDSLQLEYSSVTSFINSPLQTDAGTPTYPSCPTSSSFNASSTLPPTPNDPACSCLQKNLSCQFTPTTNNVTGIVGPLLDSACSLLSQVGGTCSDISGSGETGVYGLVSGCDPSTALSYIMSKYYEATNRAAQSCDFLGNATINPSVSTTVSATAVASSCFANAAATFTPSAPATSGSSPSSSSRTGSGSVSLVGNVDAIVGMSVMAIVAVMSAVWTLA